MKAHEQADSDPASVAEMGCFVLIVEGGVGLLLATADQDVRAHVHRSLVAHVMLSRDELDRDRYRLVQASVAKLVLQNESEARRNLRSHQL